MNIEIPTLVATMAGFTLVLIGVTFPFSLPTGIFFIEVFTTVGTPMWLAGPLAMVSIFLAYFLAIAGLNLYFIKKRGYRLVWRV